MDIQNLPTDNLYKFQAVFGLILCLGVIYTQVVLLDPSDKQMFELRLQINQAQTELQSLKEDQATLAQTDKQTKIIGLQIQGKEEEIKLITTRLNHLFSMSSLNVNVTKAGLIVGMVFMFSGFIQWYWFLQRFQDKIIRHESENKAEHSP